MIAEKPRFFQTARRAGAVASCAFALAATLAAGLWSPLRADGHITALDDPDASAVVKLEFGLRHPEPREWSGAVATSSGEAPTLWGWQFTRPDRIEQGGRFRFQVREFNPADAAYGTPYNLPTGRTVLPNGVFVSLNARETARISVTTNHGDFEFELGGLRGAGRMMFLDGDVAAVYTPPVRALTRGEASQHDFPAATYVNGELYVAWTTYHNEANALYLARRVEDRLETRRVTAAWGDYYGTALAGDSSGRVHVLFSEYRDERWRLADRVYDPQADRWLQMRYVAPNGDRQYFPQATQDASGTPMGRLAGVRGERSRDHGRPLRGRTLVRAPAHQRISGQRLGAVDRLSPGRGSVVRLGQL